MTDEGDVHLPSAMLRSYLKVALRNLLRNRTHSLINIMGLAVGLASCMFIALFIRSELGYDAFHEKGDRIYRVTHDERGRVEHGRYMATVGPQVAPTLAAEYPEIESGVRFRFTTRRQDVSADLPFSFTILDDNIEQLYAADRRFSRLISAFCFLTIIVACLGLYGLIASLTAQRVQEIGIRKVLSASVSSILALLSRQLLLLVVAANVVAWPLAYLFANRWLEDFAYRISVSPWTFAAAGVVAIAVAALTMWMQTYRAATSNPVDVIRA
ncbi:MAG TPA: FtsX-like permease family protein [Rhodothermales bacterium]|nr:FtsX-like permease family protein [Rhodothermales bacterium]